MSFHVLYLGDATLSTAAAYLAGVMHHCGISFAHFPSSFMMTDEVLGAPADVFVLSDYPADRFSDAQLAWLCERVKRGAGLVMIGGWASFNGCSGHYGRTVLADVLPVVLSAGDDRHNTWRPCVVTPCTPHPITNSLPLHRDLPCVTGFNLFAVRESACEALRVHCFTAHAADTGVAFTAAAHHPLLVVGQHGEGRIVCLAADAAPHWCGGLVDWGEERMDVTAPGAREVSVGSNYAALFENILRHAAGRLAR